MDIVEQCYKLTAKFPRDEVFGLTAQIRRASVSIAANIAEGYGREQTRSFIQFLRVAQGSVKELETHWMIAERVGLVAADEMASLLKTCESLGKMVRDLIRALERKSEGS